MMAGSAAHTTRAVGHDSGSMHFSLVYWI